MQHKSYAIVETLNNHIVRNQNLILEYIAPRHENEVQSVGII